MKKMQRSIGLAAGVLALAGAPLAAQFNHYVALGDSLTAGVEGNCLVQRNQAASFPAVLAEQLHQADFQQPLVQAAVNALGAKLLQVDEGFGAVANVAADEAVPDETDGEEA